MADERFGRQRPALRMGSPNIDRADRGGNAACGEDAVFDLLGRQLGQGGGHCLGIL
jgi:hypothetical protein